MTDTFPPLLALCARAVGHPAQQAQLVAQAHSFGGWAALPAQAEAHGLALLVIEHMRAAQVALPSDVHQQLLGAYMQHAHAARVRTQVLSDVLDAYAMAGIDVLVLKGAALAHLIYPHPHLRPMRDIDLLVRAEDVYRAYALLPEVGFAPSAGAHTGLPPDHHHLAALKHSSAGFSVSIELHHALDLNEPGGPQGYPIYARGARSFVVGRHAAQTLSREAMLWHVYRHAVCMPITYEPVRLIWLADLISLVEAWHDQIDWDLVRRRYGAVLRILPLLHTLSPWSPQVLATLRLPIGHLPATGTQFYGWPRFALAEQRAKGVTGIVRDSLFPPRWWSHIYHGIAPTPTGTIHAWLVHQMWLTRQVGHLIAGRRRLRHQQPPTA